MIGNVQTALQAFATAGNGETLVLREPRSVTFRITGNGSVTAGVITIECCPQAAPAPGRGQGRDVLDSVEHDCRSREQDNRMGRRKRVRYFPRADQHARNRRNCHGLGRSA
jgi:hypothetical protein